MRAEARLQLTRQQHFSIALAICASSAVLWIELSGWVVLLCAGALAWRTRLFFAGHAAPSRWLMLVLVTTCVGAVFASYWPPVGLEPMSIVLVSALSLKFLEVRRRADAVLTLLLCHFVAAAGLLFNQSVLVFLWTLVALALTLSAQVALERGPMRGFHIGLPPVQAFLSIGKLLLLAAPVAVLLFLALPRLPSLWAIPMQSEGRTGFSDRLMMGDVGTLARSDEVAFRASFAGASPPRSELYWRGVVLNEFDGEQWRGGEASFYGSARFASLWTERSRPSWVNQLQWGTSIEYEVFLEPHGYRWLFALDNPRPGGAGVGVTPDLLLLSREPIQQRTRYRVVSSPDAVYQPDSLTAIESLLYRRLPDDGNPLAMELANEWRDRGWGAQRIIDEISGLYRDSFVYTLSPPAYAGDIVDRFLFGDQRGFCEHFANATAFLLRAAGVPARIVLGYQGGEPSPDGSYLVVRQLDAHAWVEYWQPGAGWQRFDPTATVAPERIERGIDEIAERDNLPLSESTFSLLNYSDLAVFNWMRWQLDEINYYWARWILSYDQEHQLAVWGWIRSLVDGMRKLALLIGGIAVLALLAWWWQRRPAGDVRVRLALRAFRQRLRRAGYDVPAHLSPTAMVRQVAERVPEAERARWHALGRELEEVLYRERRPADELVASLRRFPIPGAG